MAVGETGIAVRLDRELSSSNFFCSRFSAMTGGLPRSGDDAVDTYTDEEALCLGEPTGGGGSGGDGSTKGDILCTFGGGEDGSAGASKLICFESAGGGGMSGSGGGGGN